ncbi:MAG: hypothetical protein ACXWK7_11890 [Caulobacteraceae bacterium]
MIRRLALTAVLALGLSAVAAAETLPYPDVTDTSHATPEAVKVLKAFFVAKSAHKPADMMAIFAPGDSVLYIDASSGNSWPNWNALNQIFTTMMPRMKPEALSYPLRILGDKHSALVYFEDTPELFGKELRILGAVSFDDKGRIIRWMDYWDGRSSDRKTAIAPTYPTDFHDAIGNATGRIADTAKALQAAFSKGDAKAATALFSMDAVYEDMALHTQVLGRLQIERYLTRALAKVPYGGSASVAHVVGGDLGGGYEWHAAQGFPQRRGNTAIELDKQGKISRLTVVYDSGLFADDAYRQLVQLAAE